MSFRTHLLVAGFGLAGIYAGVGVIELVAVGDVQAALVFGAGAAVTGLLILVLLPLLAPRGGDSGEEDDGGGPGGGGGGPPPPPWWPEFEREFWSHVDGPERRTGSRGPREKSPA